MNTTVYGAFKGMGDLICAAPAIRTELQSGSDVALLIFPQASPIIELLDFGPSANRLSVFELPFRGTNAHKFFRNMSQLSPQKIFLSPHAPKVVASWKIPILLWALKRSCWPRATLIGAASEPLSCLFDLRIPVNRDLPYMLREWTFYCASRRPVLAVGLSPPEFKKSIMKARQDPPQYDLVIHPGAGAENRKWPVGHFAQLLNGLPLVHRVAVVGVPHDIEALRSLVPGDRNITFLSGSLEEAIVSIARSRVALTMDSGSMFFASMLQVPTVAIFGPSNPSNVMISRPGFTAFFEAKWSCQPCRRPTCSQPQVYCMESTDPDAVLEAIGRLQGMAA